MVQNLFDLVENHLRCIFFTNSIGTSNLFLQFLQGLHNYYLWFQLNACSCWLLSSLITFYSYNFVYPYYIRCIRLNLLHSRICLSETQLYEVVPSVEDISDPASELLMVVIHYMSVLQKIYFFCFVVVVQIQLYLCIAMIIKTIYLVWLLSYEATHCSHYCLLQWCNLCDSLVQVGADTRICSYILTPLKKFIREDYLLTNF